jgi:hypothetical protein
MFSSDSWCPKCGTALAIEGIDQAGSCAFCKEAYNAIDLDSIQMESAGGRVPATDLFHANRMIGWPGTEGRLLRELRDQFVLQDNGTRVIPLSVVREYAERNGLTFEPLPPQTIPVWVFPRVAPTL